ncbi:MAG: methyltransferase domain-containing protein [Methanosarcinaceae archaeon]|nr:methyltransferase domain-containing protein [Methanosarcinaceae archaeon]
MALQKKDEFKNLEKLTECWEKATKKGSNLLDEARMAEFWNKRSESYSKNISKGKRWKKSEVVLELLKTAGFEPEGSKVLDIGCGPGTLSLPLARQGAEVTAFDISSGMLKSLSKLVKKEALPVEVFEGSWWTADIDELGFRNEYELVIASMTPGVRDIEAFEKMMACSKKLCYYSNFLSREEDKAYREIRSSILRENSCNNMNGLIFPFMYLYLAGYSPLVRINHSKWKEEMNWKEAAAKAIEFLERDRVFEEEIKEKIRAYYKKASSRGSYRSESDVYTGMMVWDVNGKQG